MEIPPSSQQGWLPRAPPYHHEAYRFWPKTHDRFRQRGLVAGGCYPVSAIHCAGPYKTSKCVCRSKLCTTYGALRCTWYSTNTPVRKHSCMQGRTCIFGNLSILLPRACAFSQRSAPPENKTLAPCASCLYALCHEPSCYGIYVVWWVLIAAFGGRLETWVILRTK
jgi:hypothetical protein